jgi:hypothetical protein
VPSTLLSLGPAIPVLAQSDMADNGATAGQSMSAAGASVKQAGSDTASVVSLKWK